MNWQNALTAQLVASAWFHEQSDKAERERTWAAKAQALYDRGHPWQKGVYDDDNRRIVLLTGGRCGKTTAMGDDLLQTMLEIPGARCLYIALTRDSAIDLLWDPLKDTLDQLDIRRHAKMQEVSLRLRLSNGSQLQLVGADDKKQIEKLRGIPRHRVWIDEAGSFDPQLLEHLIERVLGPRLGDFKGTLGIGGTPTPFLAGLFYNASRPSGDNRHWGDRDKPGYADRDGWSLHTWNAGDAAPYAPRIQSAWEEAQETKRRNQWSDSHPVWMREYLGLWAADDTDTVFRYRAHLTGEDAKAAGVEDGTPWNEWDPKRDPVTGVAILPDLGHRGGWRYVYGFDLGFSDPTAIEVFAWNQHDTTHTLYHVFEYEGREVYARLLAELLIGPELNADKPAGIIGRTGWPDGTAVDLASMGGAVLKELKEVYGISLEEAEMREKFSAIELFNGDLVDGRIKILKGSTLATQLVNNQWSRDDFGQRKRNKGQRDDCADAAVMARRRAHHLLSEEVPAPKPRPQTEYHRAGQEKQERADEHWARSRPDRGEFDDYFDDDGMGGGWG